MKDLLEAKMCPWWITSSPRFLSDGFMDGVGEFLLTSFFLLSSQ
jgi:hypothetical protein